MSHAPYQHDHQHKHDRGHQHEHGASCAHGHQHAAHDHHDHAHHDHDHSHGHHHHHGDPATQGRAFAWAIGLNSVFVVAEFSYGFIAHSTALMADAGHNLADVMSLILAWGAAQLALKKPGGRYTYGLGSTSLLAALVNALLLIFACGVIAWEAAHRFSNPAPVAGGIVSILAGLGIVINGFSAWLFMAGAKHDVNLKGAYLHLAADAAISFGVLITGLILMVRDWYWLDPLVSLAIVAMIVYGTWHLLVEAVQLVLAAVPAKLDSGKVEQWLQQQPGVQAVHDLHIWALSTTQTALTAHLEMPGGHPGDAFLDQLAQELRTRYAIGHCTLQVRTGSTRHECSLLQAHAVAPVHTHAH